MGNCTSGMIAMDVFGKKPELRLPSGSTRYNTLMGCCCTLLYTLVLIGFLGLKGMEYNGEMHRMTSMTSTIQ